MSPRGHGDSDKPGAGYGVEDLAGDAVDLLDALGIGRAMRVGHSGSCLVARRVALDHPERVRGLVLAPETVEVLAGEVLTVPAHVWRALFAALLRYDDTEELARIDAPALLVWGDRDTLVSREMQDSLAVRIPRAQSVVHRGVRHTPRWEDPLRFSRDLGAFVERMGSPP